MRIPAGVILIWDGTDATIPANFTRVTSLNGRFPKSKSSGEPGGTGGASTHTHSSTGSHSHTMIAHTHTGTTGSTYQEQGISNTDYVNYQMPRGYHSHNFSISTIYDSSTTSSAPTYSSVSNSPPYYDVIFIEADDISDVPQNSIYLWNSATAPEGTGQYSCNGSNGTPSLNGRYLRSTTGSSAGATGGSTSNHHTIDHTHISYHRHYGNSGTASNRELKGGANGNNDESCGYDHTHVIITSTAGITTSGASDPGAQSGTIEPSYYKLMAYKSTASNANQVVGGIALWMGLRDDIPLGWEAIDLSNRYVKITTTSGEIGSTGGSNTHSHSAQSHYHTVENHRHTGNPNDAGVNYGGTGSNSRGRGGGVAERYFTGPAGQHTVGDTSYSTGTLNTATTAASSSSNEPLYTEVIYIKHLYDGHVNYSKSNIIRFSEGGGNSSKASIVRTEPNNNSVKANIEPKYGNSALANIQFTYRTKKFYYRVYDGNTFKASWAGEVLSDPEFKVVINSGYSDVTVRLDRKFDEFGEEDDVKLNNRVELWMSDRESPEGKLIYSGYISGYRPVLEGSKQYLEITVLSYVGELSRYMLREASGATEVVFNSYDPSNILKGVINKYRADGGTINYTNDSINLTGTTVSYTFNTNTVREALDKVIELCPVGWYWYVDSENIIHLHEKSLSAEHNFRVKKHITKMETWRRVEDLVNRVYFTGAGDPALYRVYENASSITAYGLYAKKVVDQRVSTAATAAIISDRNMRATPEIRTKLTILDSNGQQSVKGYDIESIQVGDTLEISGLSEDDKTVSYWDQMQWDDDVWDQTLASSAVSSIQILSLTYRPNNIEIEASSRLPEVPKRIEDINRNLENTQTVNNPSTPS